MVSARSLWARDAAWKEVDDERAQRFGGVREVHQDEASDHGVEPTA
jgi:hypothetical protein